MYNTTCKLLSAIVAVVIFAATTAHAAETVFTFGYLRMATESVDSPNFLAGMLMTLRYYNEHNTIPNARFQLNITNIPCIDIVDCAILSPVNQLIVDEFIAKMPNYTAVIKPNQFLAEQIDDAAARLGNIPIIGPDDMRMRTFQPGAEHIINFNPSWTRQTDHLFTYMQQTARCAHSGIVHYGGNATEYASVISRIQSVFTGGNLKTPPSLDMSTASAQAVYDFFIKEVSRRCFIVLGGQALLTYVMGLLAAYPDFEYEEFAFYGVSTVLGDHFAINNSSQLFYNVYFTHWLPPMTDTFIPPVFTLWYNSQTDADRAAIQPTESYSPNVEASTYEGYMYARIVLEIVRVALATVGYDNLSSGPLPLTWPQFVDAFYQGGLKIDNHRLHFLTRQCPPYPEEQICFCNTIASHSYIYAVNSTTGYIYNVFDDKEKGQRDVAVVGFPNTCGYELSSWSYPITGLALFPTSIIGSNHRDAALVQQSYDMFNDVFSVMTRETNYAPTAPTRALRYGMGNIDDDISDNATAMQLVTDDIIDTLNPFIVYGTLVGTIQKTHGVLTLMGNFLDLSTEDPVLVPHAQWSWSRVQLQPRLADYIHALANYYSVASPGTFTSLHAIASVQREAELISMSFATFGYLLPVSRVVVSSDVAVWSTKIAAWLTDSTNPFVMAAVTNTTQNELVLAAVSAAGSVTRGTLALACSPTVTRSIFFGVNPTYAAGSTADVVFGAFRSEWWLPAAYVGVPAELAQYVPYARFHIAKMLVEFSKQLYSQVYFDYTTTAADVLYRIGVVSAADTSFGPFDNSTCTDAEIAANTHDRKCQCTKGIRTIYVHSMRDYLAGTESLRTNQHSWTMTTCGVVYQPYVAPPSTDSSLSSGAIAGIAVGCSAAGLLLVGAALFLTLCTGRNNRAAPKDPTRPFAIVFTDVQSSTALWARAPSAMSEAIDQHHRLLRRVLGRNSGYEVKTVGDSFMVAFKDVEDAVAFTLEAQVALFEADWSSEIDATYIELAIDSGIEAEEEVTIEKDRRPTGASSNGKVAHEAESIAAVSHSDSHRQSPLDHRSSRQHVRVPSSVCSMPHFMCSGEAGMADCGDSNQAMKESMQMGASANAAQNPDAFSNRPQDISVANHNGSLRMEADTALSVQPWNFASTENASCWHGMRVRIGIHFGHGDIRKDPVSLGYDYYGTVVNTAARVEGVGHGGQTLITEEAMAVLEPERLRAMKAIVLSLGPQPLRGLDEPIKLYQLLPTALKDRRFPPLRLHIEKDTEEDDDGSTSITGTTNAGGGTQTTSSDTPAGIISRLCGSKQNALSGLTAEHLFDRYEYFTTMLGPVNAKYKATVIQKLAEAWGFEKRKIPSTSTLSSPAGLRFTVNLLSKVTKTYMVSTRNAMRHHVPSGASQHRGTITNANASISYTAVNTFGVPHTARSRSSQSYQSYSQANAQFHNPNQSNTHGESLSPNVLSADVDPSLKVPMTGYVPPAGGDVQGAAGQQATHSQSHQEKSILVSSVSATSASSPAGR